MEYVDKINVENGGKGTKLYSTGNTHLKKVCMQNDLHLLEASVRHLGTEDVYKRQHLDDSHGYFLNKRQVPRFGCGQ